MSDLSFSNSSAPDVTLREAQQQVHEWIESVGVRYFNELTNLALLTEEVGELARIMARRYGEQSENRATQAKNSETKWPTCCGCSWRWPTNATWI